MIENISQAFDAGEVTPELIEQMLVIVHPDEADREDRRQRLMPGGNVVKFQLIGLNRQAAEVLKDQRQHSPVTPEVPDQYLVDVPEAVDDFRGPDYVPEIKSRLGIIAGVRMFGKPQGAIRDGRTEGIKVRCPFSFHEDNRPSAWVNTEKNTWYCGKCQIGGDVLDFYAAAKHDLEPERFHRSSEFRIITEEMAEALGIEVFTPLDTSSWASPLPDAAEEPEPVEELPDEVVVVEEDRENDPPVPEAKVPPSTEAAEPITVSTDEMMRGIAFTPEPNPEIGLGIDVPQYDPDRLGLQEDTFMASWVRQNAQELSWVPPEYLMMLGFQSLSLATGHSVVSKMYGLPLTGALMMVLIGPSGYGKTTAAGRLRRMLLQVDGPRWDSSMGTGVKHLHSPGSAEAMVVMMRSDIEDPMDAIKTIETPTTAWLFEDEFATFVERTRRRGGSHLKQRVINFYDFVKESPEPEQVLADFSISNKTRDVHDSYFTALFLTQTQSIRNLTDRNDLQSGFLNRIIPVFGKQRERQLAGKTVDMDPHPEYFDLYEDVWRKCHQDSTIGNPIVMEYTARAIAMIDDHPFFELADRLAEEESIYARLKHVTQRLAFLLAVNARVPEVVRRGGSLRGQVVDVPELQAAIDVVSKFIQPGYDALVEAVSADDVYELSAKVVAYLEEFHARHQRWPLVSDVMAKSFWKKYGPNSALKAMEYLRFSKQIAEVYILVSQTKKQSIMISTRGKWASFSSESGKTFRSEAFYGSASAKEK